MLHPNMVHPCSIAVVGGSNDIHKPGGKLVFNLKQSFHSGPIYIVNPKETDVQGLHCFSSIEHLPLTDLAILAIPSVKCLEVVKLLIQKGTKAFIIVSAGFSEEGIEGATIEKEITELVNQSGGTLIGPNCIGVLNMNFNAVFTSPIPLLNPLGCDFISASGATAVFIMEEAIPKGLTFSSIYSVGNCAQTCVEDILEYFDYSYVQGSSAPVKLLYLESIKKPEKILKHASSLIRKGCRIAAIKSGRSEAGSRAAMSHTGAMTNSDIAVDALFRKAGIVRCYSRGELVAVASLFMNKKLVGKNIAIITHAGGPAVILTDILSESDFNIPRFDESFEMRLLSILSPGSSAKNPIDILATGTAEQLKSAIDLCKDPQLKIDAIVVIYGSSGLNEVYDAYNIIHTQIATSNIPIYPILPSTYTAGNEIRDFVAKGNVFFADETIFANALIKVAITPEPIRDQSVFTPNFNEPINEKASILPVLDGYSLLEKADMLCAKPLLVDKENDLISSARLLGFPLVLKVVGPVHKSEIKGVVLNVSSNIQLFLEYERLKKLPGVEAVQLQKQISGTELIIGAKYEPKFGYVIMIGLGGIFVEILKDIAYGLAPIFIDEAVSMIRSLKSYPVLRGARGERGISVELFAETVVKISNLLMENHNILELDMNPLIASENGIFVVDVRILAR